MNGLWFVWRDGVGKLFGFRSLAGGRLGVGLRVANEHGGWGRTIRVWGSGTSTVGFDG